MKFLLSLTLMAGSLTSRMVPELYVLLEDSMFMQCPWASKIQCSSSVIIFRHRRMYVYSGAKRGEPSCSCLQPMPSQGYQSCDGVLRRLVVMVMLCDSKNSARHSHSVCRANSSLIVQFPGRFLAGEIKSVMIVYISQHLSCHLGDFDELVSPPSLSCMK